MANRMHLAPLMYIVFLAVFSHARVDGEIPPFPITGSQKLLTEDQVLGSQLGRSISLDGGTAVFRAYTDESENYFGAAYIFERDSSNDWHQISTLIAGDGEANDNFGNTVAVSGDTVLCGAPGDDDFGLSSGAVYIFERDAGGVNTWGQVRKLTASDAAAGDVFGINAIDGDTLIISAIGRDKEFLPDAGAVYIFERNVGGLDNWGEVRILTADDPQHSARFGTRLAIQGDLIAIGAPDANPFGGVYLYERNRGGPDNWGFVKKLTDPTTSGLGQSLAIDGDIVVAGSWSSQSAYIYSRHHGGTDNWGLVQRVSENAFSLFGSAVAIAGDVLAVGDYLYFDIFGKVYLYHRNAGGEDNWGLVHEMVGQPPSIHAEDFGYALAFDGSQLLVGAPFHTEPDVSQVGAVYSYQINDTDADGVPDSIDNCTDLSNPDQRDTDADGYGNQCDADLNNDLAVNFLDLGLMKSVFFCVTSAGNPLCEDADMNGDGNVNFEDLGDMKAGFFAPPGPSFPASL